MIVGMVIEWQLVMSRMSAQGGNQLLVRAVRAAGACRKPGGVGNHSDEGFLWVERRLREKKPGTEKEKSFLWIGWLGEKKAGTEKSKKVLWVVWRLRRNEEFRQENPICEFGEGLEKRNEGLRIFCQACEQLNEKKQILKKMLFVVAELFEDARDLRKERD